MNIQLKSYTSTLTTIKDLLKSLMKMFLLLILRMKMGTAMSPASYSLFLRTNSLTEMETK